MLLLRSILVKYEKYMAKTTKKDLTSEVTHPQVVTISVFLLGGTDRFVDTEDVAIKASSIAPGRFGWRKYPEQINLELVRVYLSDAKKPAHGGLIDGSGRRGWTLTAAGLRFAAPIARTLEGGALARDPNEAQGGSISQARRDRERRRIQQTAAWTSWSKDKKTMISAGVAKEVFRIDSYVSSDLAQIKVERLRKLFVEDSQLTIFLNDMAKLISLPKVVTL